MTRAGKTRACREDVRIKWSREKNREILLREGHAHGQTDMSDLTVLLLLQYFLFVVQSAPVGPPEPTPDLTDVAERARTLVQKILRDIPVAHAAAISTKGLTLDSAQLTNLQVMSLSLGLPVAPLLKPPSDQFTLDICVSRMLVGCQMFQKLLGVLSERVDGLMDLKVTLRDLVTHITKMTETVRLNGDTPEAPSWDAASRLPGNYEAQMAAHLTLIQLRSFCHDLTRSLRAISTYRTSAA
ncbi:uncharacterized protein LOC130515115 [Takifugu flavidus]|uniref:uncharacterized protein LOC130515115 n=1 Tax=Takifugu flavidus TaxID=433684 RepID=UPI002544B689|nr:uncharacterized protein LOC130515115 [Takifugu flavidus]XP_056871144.1 uncharacterized protein LOC130515115 [Takifugu flavidus]